MSTNQYNTRKGFYPSPESKYNHTPKAIEMPQQQQQHQPAPMQNEQALPECECGEGRITLKTCAKGKPENVGKQFFACQSCNGFMWASSWNGSKKMRQGTKGGMNEAKTFNNNNTTVSQFQQHNHDQVIEHMAGQIDSIQQTLNKILLYTKQIKEAQHPPTSTTQPQPQPPHFHVPTMEEIDWANTTY